MHFISFAASVLISTAIVARGSPLPRADVSFHILTEGTEACDDTQITAINAAITDAKLMASVALRALKVKDVQKSNGYNKLFGTASIATVQERYNFVNKLELPAKVTSLDDFQGKTHDLVFTCIPATDVKASKAAANTVNIGKLTKGSNGVVPTVNLIRFSPLGLAADESFTVAAAKLKAARGEMQLNTFKVVGGKLAPPAGFTLLHEVQHSLPILGNDKTKHFIDQKTADDKPAIGIQQVQLIADSQKPQNPQNYAFFALYAQSNPEFFLPSCFIPGPLLGTAPEERSISLFLRSLVERVTKAKPVAKPVKAAPVKAAPVKAAPVKAAPVKAAPVKVAPVAAKPVAAKPVAKPVTLPVAKPVVPAKAAPPPPPAVAPPKAAPPPAAVPAKAAPPPVAKPSAVAPPKVAAPPPPVVAKPSAVAPSKAAASVKPAPSAAAPPTSCPNLRNGLIPGVDLVFPFDDDE